MKPFISILLMLLMTGCLRLPAPSKIPKPKFKEGDVVLIKPDNHRGVVTKVVRGGKVPMYWVRYKVFSVEMDGVDSKKINLKRYETQLFSEFELSNKRELGYY